MAEEQEVRVRKVTNWVGTGFRWIFIGVLLAAADILTIMWGIPVSFGIDHPLARLGAAGLLFVVIGIVFIIYGVIKRTVRKALK